MIKKQKLSFKDYRQEVIKEIRQLCNNEDFLKRLDQYMKTEDFDNDVECDYAIGASVSACVYNLYMWI